MDINIKIYRDNPFSNIIQFNYKNICYLVILLSIVIIISLAYYLSIIAAERGGIAKYFANPIMSRKVVTSLNSKQNWNFALSLSGYGVSLLSLNIILSGILFTSNKFNHKIMAILPIILGITVSLINFSRYALIYPIFSWLFTVFLILYFIQYKQRIKILRQLLYIGIVFIIIFLMISFLIVNLRFFTSSEKGIEKAFITQLNYYITGNIVGVDQYLYQDVSLNWGKSLFRSIYKWMARIGFVEQSDVIGTHYNFTKISPKLYTNTYSYIRPLYEDFGIFGLLILSFFWGAGAASSSKHYLDIFSFSKLYLIVIFTFSFIMSFYGFVFIGITKIVLELILFIAIDKFIKKKLINNIKI